MFVCLADFMLADNVHAFVLLGHFLIVAPGDGS
jgi:hypothetical protein